MSSTFIISLILYGFFTLILIASCIIWRAHQKKREDCEERLREVLDRDFSACVSAQDENDSQNDSNEQESIE